MRIVVRQQSRCAAWQSWPAYNHLLPFYEKFLPHRIWDLTSTQTFDISPFIILRYFVNLALNFRIQYPYSGPISGEGNESTPKPPPTDTNHYSTNYFASVSAETRYSSNSRGLVAYPVALTGYSGNVYSSSRPIDSSDTYLGYSNKPSDHYSSGPSRHSSTSSN